MCFVRNDSSMGSRPWGLTPWKPVVMSTMGEPLDLKRAAEERRKSIKQVK